MPTTGSISGLKGSISEPHFELGNAPVSMPEKSASAPCLAASQIARDLPAVALPAAASPVHGGGVAIRDAVGQKQSISYAVFNRQFLQQTLTLSDARGRNHLTLTLPELMNALEQTRFTLKGSSVNHWKTTDPSRDIDLLLMLEQDSDRPNLIRLLREFLQSKAAGSWTLNEKVVDAGRNQFHKVQLGFPREGCHRIDLVIAQSMDVKFDVLQASSEIEIDLTRKSVILKKLDNPDVLSWLQKHRLLCFHPDMTGGLGRLSIYCQKGSRYLLQPGMLERFVRDSEPTECVSLVQRQFKRLGDVPVDAQKKLWTVLVDAALMEEEEASGSMLEAMRGWMRQESVQAIPAALEDPAGLNALKTGVRVGADILEYMGLWLGKSPCLREVTFQIFAEALGVELVPLPVLMDALDDLPAALGHQSLTLVHGIAPALTYWTEHADKSDSVDEDMRLRLDDHYQCLQQLPLRQCLLWLKKQPDLMKSEVRQQFEHLFTGVLASSTSMVGVNEEKGGWWRAAMIRIIETLDQVYPPERSLSNHAGIRVIANALQKCRLVMVMPEIGLMTREAHSLNRPEAAVLLCTMGGILQRLAVEHFESECMLTEGLSQLAMYLGPMFESLPQLQSRWAMERGVAWFKTSDPKADGIDWGWNAQQQKLIFLKKSESGRSLIFNCAGVTGYAESFDKNHFPDRSCTLAIRDGVVAKFIKLAGSSQWSGALTWPLPEWNNSSIKKWFDVSSAHSEPPDFSLPRYRKLVFSMRGNFHCDVLAASACEFEEALLNRFEDGLLDLRESGSGQYLQLEIGGGSPLRLVLAGACSDPMWHAVADLSAAQGANLPERLDSAFEGLGEVDLINVPPPNPVAIASKYFHVPMNWATGQTEGMGYFEDRTHGYTYKGMIKQMSLVGPGELTLKKLPGRWAMPSSLDGQIIPHPFVEFIALFLIQNSHQLNRFNMDVMEVGAGRDLPDDFVGFINFEVPGSRVRAYVDGPLLVGEICRQGADENTWEIDMGRFLRVNALEPEHEGLLEAGLTRHTFDMPWGLHLMPHGRLSRVSVDRAQSTQLPSLHSLAFFAGYQVDLNPGMQKIISNPDCKLRLPGGENAATDEVWIPANGPWRQIQVDLTADPMQDRILFISEVGKHQLTRRTVGASFNGEWCSCEPLSTQLAKLTVELNYGIQYFGMGRTHKGKFVPVPFGQIKLDGIKYVMLKGSYPAIDSFASTGKNFETFKATFATMYESQVQKPAVTAQQYLDLLADCSARLLKAIANPDAVENMLCRMQELQRLEALGQDFQVSSNRRRR